MILVFTGTKLLRNCGYANKDCEVTSFGDIIQGYVDMRRENDSLQISPGKKQGIMAIEPFHIIVKNSIKLYL